MDRFEQIAKDQGIPWDEKYNWYVSDADLKRFGQLIVKECIDHAFHNGDNIDYMANHFGIDE